MGLDTSHGCWHGAYSAFFRWREKLAEVAGYPPLGLMDGFFDLKEFWCMNNGLMIYADANSKAWSAAAKAAFAALPIRWDAFKNDPLTVLLNHSDSGGSIATGLCADLADRLEDLIPMLPEGEGGGHIGDWREKTRTFVRGLREAADAGEDVTFS